MKHTKHKLLSSIATLFVCLAMFIGSGFRQLEKVRYSNVRINSAFFMSNEKFLCSDSSGI